MKELTAEERTYLSGQLVKLADMMETCDHGDSQHRYYSKEYKRVASKLFPDQYITKARKPNRRFMSTLNRCACGSDKVVMSAVVNRTQFKCPDCDRMGDTGETRSEARDNWNKTFTA